jgi:acyl carrier protein
VLVGRRGAASPEAEQTVAALRSAGVRVEVMRADVSRTKEVEALLAEVRSKLPPLRGIFHGAMVLADSYLLNMDREAFRKPLLPKAIGAWNLHRATHSDPLDHFVLFSSLASVGGSPGQGNYAAANAFLDGLAHYRRASGLPALTANWGAISDAGYVARSGDIASYLERQGLGGMRVADALTLLGQLLREGDTQAGVMRLDIDKVLSNYASPLSARRFEHLVGSPDEGAGKSDAGERGALLRTLRAAPKEQRLQLLEAFLCEQMAYVLQIPVTSLNPEQPLASIGLDSLMSVEFEVALETQVGVRLPLGFLLSEGLSIRSLAQRLLQDLSLEGRKHTATSKSSEPETTHANA